MKTIDLTGHKVVAVRDVETAARQGFSELLVCEKTILTPSAQDAVVARGLALRRAENSNAKGTGACGCAGAGCRSCPGAAAGNRAQAVSAPVTAPAARTAPPAREDLVRLFNSPEAEAVKAEIIATGLKLWQRMYVDGNGGNISCRIGPNAVICTPTLLSKADLRPEDLCLVDLDGNQLLGKRPRTSEILLHLEIYKNVPEAKAAVHCHPPHATAYAITGRVPPTCIIPEFEVFVGKVAYTPYETPGTQKFAETVIPFVKNHNTVLLGNHGVICWADTVTHAEWSVEVLDTYCWTLMLAAQIGQPISYIPADKTAALLNMKKRLGLPDARHDADIRTQAGACQMCPMPDDTVGISVCPGACCTPTLPAPADDVDAIVRGVTDAVMAALDAQRG
jgi:L-fuculose-phosphate aldolase